MAAYAIVTRVRIGWISAKYALSRKAVSRQSGTIVVLTGCRRRFEISPKSWNSSMTGKRVLAFWRAIPMSSAKAPNKSWWGGARNDLQETSDEEVNRKSEKQW